jgi:hypothetical protein
MGDVMATMGQIARLYARLVEVLGRDEADTLMELLQIPGWSTPAAIR